MDFETYVKLKGDGEMTRLHRESGVSYATIWKAAKDHHFLDSWKAAKKLSAATGGVVSMQELCEAPVKRKRGRSKRESGSPELA